MANRISYLKFLSQNKNAYISDIAMLNDSDIANNQNNQSGNDVKGKMN